MTNLGSPPEQAPEPGSVGRGLAAQEIVFGYRQGTVPVLDGWSATFRAGTMTALTGPSGSGKSTLLYLLGLMSRPQRGSVTLDGSRVDHLSEDRRADLRARQFGFIFQDALLDPSRTVLDNVIETALYRRASRAASVRAAIALLDRLGVAVRATHRPGEISGGQAQRIAVCRALLADPSVLLADEPTGNLDSGTGRVVLDALRKQADNGAVVVIATHEDRVVAACDRHVRLTCSGGQP